MKRLICDWMDGCVNEGTHHVEVTVNERKTVDRDYCDEHAGKVSLKASGGWIEQQLDVESWSTSTTYPGITSTVPIASTAWIYGCSACFGWYHPAGEHIRWTPADNG